MYTCLDSSTTMMKKAILLPIFCLLYMDLISLLSLCFISRDILEVNKSFINNFDLFLDRSRALTSSRYQSKQMCTCDDCFSKSSLLKSKYRPLWKQKKLYILIVGWISFSVIAYYTWQARSSFPEGYDPFAIMGLSHGATEAEIRKQYKVLSLKLHPDKVPDKDKQEAEERFIEMTKAYKVLTNEDIRKNFEETGNPDGIKNFTLGIALPSWLIEEGNMFKILSIYVLAFMIFLPIYIGKWWSRSKNYTKSNIHYFTMARYYQELSQDLNMRKLIEIISLAYEYQERFTWTRQDTENIPQLLIKIRSELETVTGEKYERSKKFSMPFCTKAFALIMSHMLRIPLTSPDLIDDQRFAIEKAFHLIPGMIQISIAREWSNITYQLVTLGQLLIQGSYDQSLPLLQLPGITNEMAKNSKVKNINSFINEKEKQVIFPSVNDTQLTNMMIVAKSIPHITLVKALIQVLGQDDITPSSIVTVAIYAVLTDDIEQVKTIKIDQDESLFALNFKSNDTRRKEENLVFHPYIHAPLFPIEKRPAWWALLSTKDKKIVGNPTKIYSIPYTSDYLKGKLLEPCFVTQFTSPKQSGTYSYQVDLCCDSYYGVDLNHTFKITVVDDGKSKYGNAVHVGHDNCSSDGPDMNNSEDDFIE